MGNPLYGDDLGQMCFNPAKLWQLQHYPHPTTVTEGWYDSAAFVTIDNPASPQEFKMMGVGEYNLQGECMALLGDLFPYGIFKQI